MASFAERMGRKVPRSIVQRDSLDLETRNEIWNNTFSLRRALAGAHNQFEGPLTYEAVTSSIWAWAFKRARDEQPGDGHVWGQVKGQILECDWIDALDLVETILGYSERFKNYNSDDIPNAAADLYNNTFENLMVGFRFVDFKLVPIDSETELDAVTSALDDTKSFKGARHALSQAAELLADRKNPDYPNSIKESISAVEAVCREITGEQTLGAAIKKLQGAGVKVHPALERAWTAMYGWTSDEDGIRHGSIDAPDADQALAKYMLVACSAFVSYVIQAASKARLA